MSLQHLLQAVGALEQARAELPPVPKNAALVREWRRKRRLVPLSSIGHVADLAIQNGGQVLGIPFDGEGVRAQVRELEAVAAASVRARELAAQVELDGVRRHLELADSAWRILQALEALDGAAIAPALAGRGRSLREQFPKRSHRRRKVKQDEPPQPEG